VNKNLILICIIFLLFSQAGFTEDVIENVFTDDVFTENVRVISIGIGPELNMNSRENYAGGLSLNMEYQLPVSRFQLSTGLTVTLSHNFSNTFVFEATGMFRWYFPDITHNGFFTQIDLGTHMITERGVFAPLFEAGLRAGYRMPLGEKYYIEPYGRFGFPYFWGAGVLAGINFQKTKSPKKNTNNITDYETESYLSEEE